jgi:hypothetical protein
VLLLPVQETDITDRGLRLMTSSNSYWMGFLSCSSRHSVLFYFVRYSVCSVCCVQLNQNQLHLFVIGNYMSSRLFLLMQCLISIFSDSILFDSNHRSQHQHSTTQKTRQVISVYCRYCKSSSDNNEQGMARAVELLISIHFALNSSKNRGTCDPRLN